MTEDSKKTVSPIDQEFQDDIQPDEETLEKIKEILHLMAITSTQMKIFSSEHANVKKFADDLYEKTNKFLDENWKLELGIEEFSFTYQGKTVYTESQISKSLPFLFFKDGMQILFFYKGLKKEEFQEFLEILRMISSLPPEESDIVISLWERDFANIRYYAPDEFLETKIGVGMEPVKYRLDKNDLSTGTIELAPEDKSALSQNDLSLETYKKTAEKPEDLIEKGEEFSPVAQSISLNDEEAKTLELMLRSNRKISSEDELLSLLIEMLYLEERPEQFNITLNALAHFQKDLLLKGDFSRALQLFILTLELKESLPPQFDEEAKLLENFLKDLSNSNSLASIKKVSQSGQVSDLKSFFNYLKLLGPEAIHLVGDLYEDSKDPGFRINALDYFKELGQKNIAALMDIVHDNRPALATEIISLSSAFNDKRTIHYLANFISYKNKTIKFEAVKALGKFGDKAANTILMGFLADKDEGLRILAAQELQPSGDSSILDRIKQLVLNKKFIKKRRMEKKALLELLGRSQTEEACDMLRNIMKKISIFSLPKRIETSLCAVSALEVMQTPEAHKALDEGVHMHNKKISQACKYALKKISSKETSKNQVKEK